LISGEASEMTPARASSANPTRENIIKLSVITEDS